MDSSPGPTFTAEFLDSVISVLKKHEVTRFTSPLFSIDLPLPGQPMPTMQQPLGEDAMVRHIRERTSAMYGNDEMPANLPF